MTTSSGGVEFISSSLVIDPLLVFIPLYPLSGAVVSNGGVFTVSSGQTATSATVLSGGKLVVLSGAQEIGTTDSGGSDVVSSGGSATSTLILNGGVETVLSGGTTTSAKIGNGGQQIVSGTASGTEVQSGGVQIAVGAAAAVSGTIIDSGGVMVLSNFFAVHNPLVQSGGEIDLPSLTFVSSGNARLNNGTLIANQGGSTDSFLVSGAYGNDMFLMLPDGNGGTLLERVAGFPSSGAVVSSGFTLYVSSGQTETSASVLSGGKIIVLSGGQALGTILSGGSEFVSSGGVESGAKVLSGGVETVSSGGVASATIVSSGGVETVLSGGLASGAQLSGGTETVSSGGVASGTHVFSGGVETVLSGATESGGVIGNGGQQIVSGTASGTEVQSGGVQIAVGAAAAVSGTIIDSGGVMVLSNFFAVQNPILNRGGEIDLPSLAFVSSGNATLNGGALSVNQGGSTDNFALSGSYGVDLFEMLPGTFGGTMVLRVAFCFMAGTAVRTPVGSVAVETLRRGDLVMTAEGVAKPVLWVGRQTVSTRFGDPMRIVPIRIKAGALAENTPSRDLLLSPDHAILLDGVMIQAGALVNGVTILREADVPETFTYYYVELDDHSLILAEDVPAETFIDNVDRLGFDNWEEHEALFPQGKPMRELTYARIKSQRQTPQRLRAHLAERAAVLGQSQERVA